VCTPGGLVIRPAVKLDKLDIMRIANTLGSHTEKPRRGECCGSGKSVQPHANGPI